MPEPTLNPHMRWEQTGDGYMEPRKVQAKVVHFGEQQIGRCGVPPKR